MKNPIEDDIWVPVWDQIRYEGQRELVFEGKNLKTVKHRHYKCVSGNISTTNTMFKRLLGCASWCVYFNDKLSWYYGIDVDGMTNKHGFVIWERKIPIPWTFTDEDKIRIEIIDIADMGEIKGHGISVNLNCYVRKCDCDYCQGKLGIVRTYTT